MWLIGAVVYLHAAPWVQLFAYEGNGWPHNAPQVSLAHANQYNTIYNKILLVGVYSDSSSCKLKMN